MRVNHLILLELCFGNKKDAHSLTFGTTLLILTPLHIKNCCYLVSHDSMFGITSCFRAFYISSCLYFQTKVLLFYRSQQDFTWALGARAHARMKKCNWHKSYKTVVLKRGASINFQAGASPYAPYNMESLIITFTNKYTCFQSVFKVRGDWNKGKWLKGGVVEKRFKNHWCKIYWTGEKHRVTNLCRRHSKSCNRGSQICYSEKNTTAWKISLHKSCLAWPHFTISNSHYEWNNRKRFLWSPSNIHLDSFLHIFILTGIV